MAKHQKSLKYKKVRKGTLFPGKGRCPAVSQKGRLNMSRRVLWVLGMMVAFGALMTLSGATKAEAQALKGSPGEEYLAVACMGNLEYFSAHKFAWKWMGDKLGVKTSYIGPAEYDVPGEISSL